MKPASSPTEQAMMEVVRVARSILNEANRGYSGRLIVHLPNESSLREALANLDRLNP